MSLIPYLGSQFSRHFFPEIYDQHFGNVLENFPAMSLMTSRWSNIQNDISNIKFDKEGFKAHFDVQHFKPEELKVTVVENHLVVHARHDERTDEHGFISREFTRRFKLPESINTQAMVPKLSSDGILSLEAPRKGKETDNMIEIPIHHTNAPAIKPAGHHVPDKLLHVR